jgi:hypothetical protein
MLLLTSIICQVLFFRLVFQRECSFPAHCFSPVTEGPATLARCDTKHKLAAAAKKCFFWKIPQHVFRGALLLFLFLTTWLFIKGKAQHCTVITPSSGDLSFLASSSTIYPSVVNWTLCTTSMQLE